jgi:hypothetical protein
MIDRAVVALDAAQERYEQRLRRNRSMRIGAQMRADGAFIAQRIASRRHRTICDCALVKLRAPK